MTRLESGPLRLNTGPVELSDVVGSALRRARKILAITGREVRSAARPADARCRCSAVRAGAVQPAGQCRQIRASRLADHHQGVARQTAGSACRWSMKAQAFRRPDLERVFDKFYRVGVRGSAACRHGARPRHLPRLRRGDARHDHRRATARTAPARSFTITLPAFVNAERPAETIE